MYVPEYTITKEILNNIALIEYGKGIIENTTILPNWEKQLEKEATKRIIQSTLEIENYNISAEVVKKFVDGISATKDPALNGLKDALEKIAKISFSREFEEDDIKDINKALTKSGRYRSKKELNGANPEEILAKMVELMDWYFSLDAKDTHPVILAGILKTNLEAILPFDSMNRATADLSVLLVLKTSGYGIKDYIAPHEYHKNTLIEYRIAYESIEKSDDDLTDWLEYFTEGMANEVTKIKEQILLLARDTKVAKVSGRAQLTDRQERVIEFIQDYGLMQNKDFPKIFPNVSEDTVLRDIKVLMTEGIIVKKGKTKSSRYELK